MNITDLKIDAFGIWQGLEIDGISPHLNVFYGANEAGKTTLLHFVRSVLYGYSPARRSRYLPPVTGGRAGGSLRVDGSHGAFTVSRHDVDGTVNGQLQVIGADGMRQSESLLQNLLSGMDEKTYTHVFAVGLRELQELGTLSDSAASDYLYKLTTGIDRVSLTDVLRELDGSRRKLLSMDGHPGDIDQLLAEREKLRAEIEKLGGQSRGFARLVAQRDEAQRELTECEAGIARLREELQHLEIAIAAHDKWRARAALAERLEELEGVEPPAAGLLKTLDDMNLKLGTRRQQLASTRRELNQLRKPGERVPVNDIVLRQAARIEGLCEHEPWLASLEAEAADLQTTLATLETRLNEERQRLGIVSGAGKYGSEATAAVPESLRPLASSVRSALHKAKQAERELEQARARVDGLKQKISSVLSHQPDGSLTAALERAGALVTQLRHRVQVEQRLEELQLQEQQLAEENRDSLEKQLLPAGWLWGLGLLFAAGLALVLFGFNWQSDLQGEMFVAMVIFGMAAAGLSVMRKVMMERDAERRLAITRRQLQGLAQQIHKVQEERDALDAALPRSAGTPLARMQAAERELASLEELVTDDARHQQLERDVATAETRFREARSAYRKARQRWDDGLRALGFPAGISPSKARGLARDHGALEDLLHQIEQARRDLNQRQRDIDQFRQRVVQMTAEAGLPAFKGSVLEQMRLLKQALESEQQQASRRSLQNQRGRRLRRHATKLLQAIRWGKLRRMELIRQAGAADEDELRQRAELADEAIRLQAEFDRLSDEIAALLVDRGSEDDLAEWLGDDGPAELEQRLRGLSAELKEAEKRLKQLYEHRGQLTQELKQLSEDRRPHQRALELGVIEQRLKRAVERWQVIGLTQTLLETVRSRYEAQRQPETLREASLYFHRLTDGQYTRVWTPMDQDVLRVDEAGGKSLPVDVLSRGTRELVFLSLRMALVNLFARRGINLPVVLDDVLVNFDQERARSAARALVEFAESGHQVLSFTCHEHLFELFRSMDAAAWRLPDSRQHPAGKAPRIVFHPPEPEPEPEPEYQQMDLATWSEAETIIEPDEPPAEVELHDEPELVAEPAAPQPIAERLELVDLDDGPEPEPPNLNTPLLDLGDDEEEDLELADDEPDEPDVVQYDRTGPYEDFTQVNEVTDTPIMVAVDDDEALLIDPADPPPADAPPPAPPLVVELKPVSSPPPPEPVDEAPEEKNYWPVYRWRAGPLDRSQWQQSVIADVNGRVVEVEVPPMGRQREEGELLMGASRAERWADHKIASTLGTPRPARRRGRNGKR